MFKIISLFFLVTSFFSHNSIAMNKNYQAYNKESNLLKSKEAKKQRKLNLKQERFEKGRFGKEQQKEKELAESCSPGFNYRCGWILSSILQSDLDQTLNMKKEKYEEESTEDLERKKARKPTSFGEMFCYALVLTQTIQNFCSNVSFLPTKENTQTKIIKNGVEKYQKRMNNNLDINLEECLSLGENGTFSCPLSNKLLVASISRSGLVTLTPNIPEIIDMPVNAPLGKDIKTGKPIKIAVWENQLSPDHELLRSRIVKRDERKRDVGGVFGHGTKVASVIAVIAPKAEIHHISDLTLWPPTGNEYEKFQNFRSDLKIKQCENEWTGNLKECPTSEQSEKLEKYIDNFLDQNKSATEEQIDSIYDDSDIINMSRTIYFSMDQFKENDGKGTGMPYHVIAASEHRIVVLTLGNKGKVMPQEADVYFGNSKNRNRIVFVGATTVNEKGQEMMAEFSNFAPKGGKTRVICAPGENVLVGNEHEEKYEIDSGTSFAAPMVSGVLADLRGAYPQWKEHPEIYTKILFKSARKMTLDGKNDKEKKNNYKERIGNKCGVGIMDVGAALMMADYLSKYSIEEILRIL